jgi:hypothetical protein
MVRGKPERDNPGAPFRDRVAPSVMQWGTDGAEPCFIIFRIMVPSFIRITPLSINRQFTGRGGGNRSPFEPPPDGPLHARSDCLNVGNRCSRARKRGNIGIRPGGGPDKNVAPGGDWMMLLAAALCACVL